MKKRIISAVLALLMAISCVSLTSCGDEEKIDTSKIGARVATTLTLWLPAAKGTSVDDESVALVERAINEITQAEYDTAIKLSIVPAEDYDKAVADKLQSITESKNQEAEDAAEKRKKKREAAEKGEEYVEDTVAEDTESVVDTENKYEAMNATLFTKYPALSKTQFDIFLVHGEESYNELITQALLSDLTDNLNDESRVLKSYIYGSFFESVVKEGATYAVPNNHPLGQFKMMLINKKVASDLYYDPEGFTSVADLFTYDNSGISFVEDVAKNVPGVTPVMGSFDASYVHYWNENNDDTFSAICSLETADTTLTDVTLQNSLQNTNVINSIYYSKKIKEITTPAAVGSTDNFAVGFVEGSYEDYLNYQDKYAVTIIEKASPDTEDLMQSMFAVSSYTKDVDRSMEIIKELNTNQELRTILQYGIEGTHWKKDIEDDSVIHVISDKYKMDLIETGNEYMTYPADGVSMDKWESIKLHNVNSYMPASYGFVYKNESTAPVLAELATKSAEIKAKIDGMTADEFNANVKAMAEEINGMECVKALLYDYNPDSSATPEYPPEQSLVYAWSLYVKSLTEN